MTMTPTEQIAFWTDRLRDMAAARVALARTLGLMGMTAPEQM